MTRLDTIMGAGARIFGHFWVEDVALRQIVRKRAKRHIERLRKLGRLPANTEQQRRAIFHTLRSFDARFCSLIAAWPKGHSPIDLHTLEGLAHEIDVRWDCSERVKGRIADKTGGWRPICSFGPKRRALQALVRDVLEAVWGASQFEYSRRGRGRDVALQAMMVAVEKGGARWFVTSDIKACFRSFDREKLIRLMPLPKAVVENCILIPDTTHVHIHPNKHLDHPASEIAVRQGIPQGSLASSFIAAKLLEPVLAQLKGVVILSHGDDIAIGCRTKVEAETTCHALAALLEQHPAGPLLLKSNAVARMGTPIDFLGYRLRWRSWVFGGGTRLTPSKAAFDKYETKLTTKLLTHNIDELELVARQWTAHWQGGYPLWDRSRTGDEMVWMTAQQWVIPYARMVLKKQLQPSSDPPEGSTSATWGG